MLSIFEMSKRYIAGAVVGFLVSLLAAVGISELPPEQLENIRLFVDSFLVAVFYIATILFKTWQQKRALKRGEVVPERVDHISRVGG